MSEYEDGTSRPMFKKRLKTVVTRSKYNEHKQKAVISCYMYKCFTTLNLKATTTAKQKVLFVLKDHLSNSSESSADDLHEISSLSQ